METVRPKENNKVKNWADWYTKPGRHREGDREKRVLVWEEEGAC